MKWITEYFINKALKKASERQSQKKKQLLGKIKKIGIIAPSLVEMQDTRELIKSELGPHVEISGLFYGEDTDAKEAFSHRDFSGSARPREKITKFIANKSDVIIASSENMDIFSLYLLYLNPEPYSIGFYQESHKNFLDLMLANDGGKPNENMEHLIRYLKQVILK